MSDTKWQKLFSFLYASGIKKCRWKFLNDDHVYDWGVPSSEEIETDAYVGLKDRGGFQPVRFSDIEWIEIFVDTNVDSFVEQLDTLGKFEIASKDNAIQLFGYK
ncbi:MAG: hypothetical protein COU35_01985 [Candidatus Magasanikbacteria bacterium CG10_big_fil_rev_8_21_14_0_10_47_10]|uniref:Uncharacterized protein n=1 Tax=Candidatus Magasanikbacteria bacterium CG10_big_fil_rev_8_21_14_0_10_47_10 TaxID=1974652 RepID=A0A2H0TQU0_9BACT|nr:MAG: hypothetical protein COU35_01985 [Candidatus Magasanikbacteria bacterium CG10_big_fil_rev_8_21_14_0_10_47_10]